MKSSGINLNSYLKKIPQLSIIAGISKASRVKIWLVGGFLRDAYLGRKKTFTDFDFCLEKDTLKTVKKISRKLKCKVITLDKKLDSYRLVKKTKARILTYDFNQMRGKNLKEDVYLRDFTINTLAVDINQRPKKIIDYYGGIRDLKRSLIRITQTKVLRDDPLRVLRGFTFSCALNFPIEKKTLESMVSSRPKLKKTAKERIAEELFKILACKNSYKTIKIMDSFKVLDEIIPLIKKMRGVTQGGYHHLDVWDHSLETLRQFETLYLRKLIHDLDVFSYLNKEVSSKHSRLQLIKLAALLHDIGKPAAKKKLKKKTIFYEHEKIGQKLTKKISESLRLSAKEKDILMKLVFWHLRPGYLADQINPSRRAVYHFFRDTQDEGMGVIILSLSDWRATRGPLTSDKKRRRHEKIMLGLLAEHIAESKKKPLPKLINGYDIMSKFNLESSPLIGDILKKVIEDQQLGKITTKPQAIKLVSKLFKSRRK